MRAFLPAAIAIFITSLAIAAVTPPAPVSQLQTSTQKAGLPDESKSAAKAAPPASYSNIGGIAVAKTPYAQRMIQKYIARYTSSFGCQELYRVLDEGESYRLYIRQELKKRKMPPALEYLALVESNYQPLATSKSGARGLWQFMENSIAGLLHKNDWVDERLDPWLSTDAALTKLQDNYHMFRDWPLAIAAYNCGAGAMQRILKKAKVKTFWYIAEQGLLRDQSVQYLPKLLAVTELSEHGQAYGVALPEITSSTRFAEFDYLETRSQVFLDRLSAELRMEESLLLRLNPGLLKKCTPPDDSYRLRLPAGMKGSAAIALSRIEADFPHAVLIAHRVEKGDTLYSLSRRYGSTVAAICRESSIKKNDLLAIGKVLYIPVESAENN